MLLALLASAFLLQLQQDWGEIGLLQLTVPQVGRVSARCLPRRQWTRADLLDWLAQTQRRNAGADHDVLTVRAGLGTRRVGGFFANGEIGPVGGRNHLHAFTASMLVLGYPAELPARAPWPARSSLSTSEARSSLPAWSPRTVLC